MNQVKNLEYKYRITAKKTSREGPLAGLQVDYSLRFVDIEDASWAYHRLNDQPLTYSDVTLSVIFQK